MTKPDTLRHSWLLRITEHRAWHNPRNIIGTTPGTLFWYKWSACPALTCFRWKNMKPSELCRTTSRDVNLLELHLSFGQPDCWSGSDNCYNIMFGIVEKLLSRWTQLQINYSCYFHTVNFMEQKPPRILEMCFDKRKSMSLLEWLSAAKLKTNSWPIKQSIESNMCVAMHNVTNNKDDKACGWVVVGRTTAELSPIRLFVCTVHCIT